MEQSEKPVPVFLVIAPDFSEESEVEATRYHAEHFSRNFVLITAGELKPLAEEWSSRDGRSGNVQLGEEVWVRACWWAVWSCSVSCQRLHVGSDHSLNSADFGCRRQFIQGAGHWPDACSTVAVSVRPTGA